MRSKPVIYDSEIILAGRSLPINANAEAGYSCYRHILERTDQQLSAMLSHHCKVQVIRLDLHLREYSSDNQVVSDFMHKLKKRAASKLGLHRFGYVWVRELERAKSQHYHLAFMVDGNKIQNPHRIIELGAEIWQEMNQARHHIPAKASTMVKRGDNESYRNAFYRLSYFAKPRGKGYRSKYANDYGTSRIRLRWRQDCDRKKDGATS